MARKRSELYGFIDFIANMGGILGLFTGISIISLVEFLYFVGRGLVASRKVEGPQKNVELEMQKIV